MSIPAANLSTELDENIVIVTDNGKSILQRSISEINQRSFINPSSNQMQLINSMKHPTFEISSHKTLSTKCKSNRSINLNKSEETIPIEKNNLEKKNIENFLNNEQLEYTYSEPDEKILDLFFTNEENECFCKINSFEENSSDTEESEPEYDLNENGRMTGFFEKTLPFRCECQICMDSCFVNERQCCSFKSCNKCINFYIQNKIKESCGNLSIECLNNECNKLINKDEICERMFKFDIKTHDLYLKILIDANKNSDRKTCPQCSFILDIKSIQKMPLNKSKVVTKCKCTKCELIWCFKCHAPWHEGISCAKYVKADNMLKYWAKEVHFGQQNAQKCPKCKIYIQRIKGCDHMICSNCKSGFCYSCGKKFRSIKFFGDHQNKFSVLGCKYKLYPDKPFKRKLIRGSIFGAKIAATPFIITVGLVLGVGVLAAGTLALPVYGSYKLYKYAKFKRRVKKISKTSSFKNENTENRKITNFFPNMMKTYKFYDYNLD